MGMTGTGKTTIVSLLQRFYDVTDGRILLDGHGYPDDSACHSCERRCVSRHAGGIPVLGFSQQKMYRTGQTGGHGRRRPSEWAAERGRSGSVYRRVSAERYDTVIGERGVGLSGGQKAAHQHCAGTRESRHRYSSWTTRPPRSIWRQKKQIQRQPESSLNGYDARSSLHIESPLCAMRTRSLCWRAVRSRNAERMRR